MRVTVLMLFLMLIWPSVTGQFIPSSGAGTPSTTVPPPTPEEMRLTLLMWEVLKSQQTLIESLGLTLDEVKAELQEARRTNAEMRAEMTEVKAGMEQLKQQVLDVRIALDEEREESKKKLRKATLTGTIFGAALVSALILIF